MSVSFPIPETENLDVDFNARLRYSLWCSKNLTEEGEARTWKIYSYEGNYRIVFYHEADAVAFKLRFGL